MVKDIRENMLVMNKKIDYLSEKMKKEKNGSRHYRNIKTDGVYFLQICCWKNGQYDVHTELSLAKDHPETTDVFSTVTLSSNVSSLKGSLLVILK